jgi:hypothetical protein
MTETEKLELRLEAYEDAYKIIKGHYWDTSNEAFKIALDIIDGKKEQVEDHINKLEGVEEPT